MSIERTSKPVVLAIAAIEGAEYAELPTGHLAPLEQPDAIVALIDEFLRRR